MKSRPIDQAPIVRFERQHHVLADGKLIDRRSFLMDENDASLVGDARAFEAHLRSLQLQVPG